MNLRIGPWIVILLAAWLCQSKSLIGATVRAESVVQDPGGKLGIADVTNLCPVLPCANALASDKLHKGIQWLGFSLAKLNHSQTFYFSSKQRHKSADFYFTDSQNLIKHIPGGFSNRSQDSGVFSLKDVTKIYLPPNGTGTLWLRVDLEMSQTNIFSIFSREQILHDELFSNSFSALYIGIVGAMLFYNLFLFLTTRSTIHIFYVGFISSVYIPTVMFSLAALVLEIDLVLFSTHFIPFIGLFGIALTLQFLKDEVPDWQTKVSQLAIKFLLLTALGLLLTSPEFRIKVAVFLGVISSMWSIFILAIATMKSPRMDKGLFLLSWFLFLIGISIYGLEQAQLVPSNLFTQNAYKIGQVFEVTLISLVLVIKHGALGDQATDLEKKGSSFSRLLQSLHSEILRYQRSVNDMVGTYEPGNQTCKKGSERIKRSLGSLHQVAQQINQFKTNRSGSIEISQVNLAEVFQEVKFLFEAKLEEKHIGLDIANFDSSLKVLANHSVLVHQILSNLLSNAIKFSPKDSMIEVRITNRGPFIEISLKDHGIGIPPDILENLFQHDQESNREGTEGESGTGFGVPLAKNFTNALGGYLRVETKTIDQFKDHGTTFKIGLKQAKNEELVA